MHIAGPTLKAVSEHYPGAEFVGCHANFAPELFARTIAKIGFCAGVYTLGLGPFTQTPIRKIILGSDPSIGHWVGSWHNDDTPINETNGGLHAIKVLYNPLEGDIHVIVRLFAQYNAPEYHVILGPADPEFAVSDEWFWK
jgi:hypothetical protein